MKSQVQYAHAAGGTQIAYWTLGKGHPIVYLPGGPWSHVELQQLPACQHWYERLARRWMLARYDMRGTGFSDRDARDYSLDTLVSDLEAVVDERGLQQFALLGAADAGPVTIAYAARHPDRVSQLILWCAWARNADMRSPRIQAWLSLIDQDWDLMTETCAHIVFGWSGGEIGRQAVQRLRETVSREAARAALQACGEFDVTPLLRRLTAPTMVLHRDGISWLPVDIARRLAAGIPGAHLVILPGESTAPYMGDTEGPARVIDEFLEETLRVPGHQKTARPAATVQAKSDSQWTRAYPAGLTEREVQVLRLLASGLTNSEIARELVLSVRTVERHVANVYAKIGARRRVDAAAYALTRSLI